jgi:hypothetical protein
MLLGLDHRARHKHWFHDTQHKTREGLYCRNTHLARPFFGWIFFSATGNTHPCNALGLPALRSGSHGTRCIRRTKHILPVHSMQTRVVQIHPSAEGQRSTGGAGRDNEFQSGPLMNPSNRETCQYQLYLRPLDAWVGACDSSAASEARD